MVKEKLLYAFSGVSNESMHVLQTLMDRMIEDFNCTVIEPNSIKELHKF
jgi:hypothetical protein